MLDVKRLTKQYAAGASNVAAVRDVSFSVREGEFFTLLGPSGCGKTTTLRCIAGLEFPDEGEIAIAGRIAFSAASGQQVAANRRDIAMVFQSYAVWPHMSVLENVRFPLDAKGMSAAAARSKAMDALAMVGLADVASRSATKLSGGQQQRVALARAITKGAKLLLLDEPLSNLDAQLRLQMREELRNLQRQIGTTAIYVTHDQEEALNLSTRVALMRNGRLVEVGPPEELYLRPKNAFTAEFIGQAIVTPCSIMSQVPDGIRVSTPFGPIVAGVFPIPAPMSPTLLMRPEHVGILPASNDSHDADSNTLPGRIQSAVFSGKVVDYLVEVNGQSIRAQATSTRIFSAGDQVKLHVPVSRCILLEAGAT